MEMMFRSEAARRSPLVNKLPFVPPLHAFSRSAKGQSNRKHWSRASSGSSAQGCMTLKEVTCYDVCAKGMLNLKNATEAGVCWAWPIISWYLLVFHSWSTSTSFVLSSSVSGMLGSTSDVGHPNSPAQQNRLTSSGSQCPGFKASWHQHEVANGLVLQRSFSTEAFAVERVSMLIRRSS